MRILHTLANARARARERETEREKTETCDLFPARVARVEISCILHDF